MPIENNANSKLQYNNHNRICEIENCRTKVKGIKPASIFNNSKKTVLSEKFKFCDDILSKAKGLMFSKKRDKALIFKFNNERIISLHMFFVFYPIDVIFLDKRKIVVDDKEDFKPFTFYKSRKKAMYAVELPAGAIRKSKTNIGDKLEF